MPPYISIPFALLVFFFILYVFSLVPRRRRAAPQAFMGYHYAHRGLHNRELPENSLAAFSAAAEAGYGIELDVQLSRDGVAMVFHDATLARVCGKEGKVCDYTAEELQAMPLCGNAAHTIPTLAAVLAEVNGRVPLLVEIKGYRTVAPVCEAAAALLDEYKGAYMVESFTPYAVHWFKKNRPAVVRGQLSSHLFVKGKRSIGNLIVQSLCCNFIARPDFVAYCYRDRRRLSFRLLRFFYRPYTMAWTVKDEAGERESAAFHDIIFEGYLPERKKEKK